MALALHSKRLGANGAEVAEDQFQISTVARLTGLSAHTIRAWEKRHGVVSPDRTDSKRRLYNRDEVQRLTLLKSLVDSGHAIGTVANLSISQLENRLREDREAVGDGAPDSPASASSCRVITVGDPLDVLFANEGDQLPELEVVGCFGSIDEANSGAAPPPAELVLIESPTLFTETVEAARMVVERSGARRAILIYRFASRDVVNSASAAAGVTVIRGPVNAAELRLACLADIRMRASARAATAGAVPPTVPAKSEIPERRFTAEQLARISRASTKIRCECPQHLANLLFSLTAFESYSEECENRNPADAELHAFLHQSTAHSRSVIEEALNRVIEAEGIEID